MANTQDVETKIGQMFTIVSGALESETESGYQQLQTHIYDLEALAREAAQAKLNELCQSILKKLENEVPLSNDEQETVRLLLIGEAEYYLEHEDDVDLWRDELVRLVEEIRNLQTSDLNEVDNLMRLRAFCREAMRVIPDLAYYFGEKERIRKFEDASQGTLAAETRQVLIDLIRAMMGSDRV